MINNSSNSENFEVDPSSNDHVVVGLVYLIFAILVLILYVPCMLAIIKDSELRSMLSYRIIFNLGLSDLVQTFFHGVGGILTMMKTGGPYVMNVIFGGIMNSCWMSYGALLHLLAFNRFVHFCLAKYEKKIFSPRMIKVCLFISSIGIRYKYTLSFSDVWLGFAWLHAVIWLILYYSPVVDFVFVPSEYAWLYSGPYGAEFMDVELYQTCIHFGLTGLEYIAIWISIRLIRKRMSNQENASNAEKNERRIMVQGGLLVSYPTLQVMYWHIAPRVLPESYGKWISVSCNLFWISNGAINPVIYLTMNKTLRNKVLALFGFKVATQEARTPKGRGQHISNRVRSRPVQSRTPKPRSRTQAVTSVVATDQPKSDSNSEKKRVAWK